MPTRRDMVVSSTSILAANMGLISESSINPGTQAKFISEPIIQPSHSDDTLVNVKLFGAVGDNTTNDHAAITAAINYAVSKNKAVCFPSGKYYTGNASILVKCPLYGNSCTLRGWLTLVGNDIFIKDMNIVSTNSGIGVFMYGSVTVPTFYYRQKLLNVKITFDRGVATAETFGVYASNIANLSISDCYIQYAIQLIGCPDYSIINNVIDGVNYSNNNELIHASCRSYGLIANNHFKDSMDNFIDLFSSGERTIITNNKFEGNMLRLGCAIEIKVTMADDSNSSSDTWGWDEQIIFSNNIIYNCQLTSTSNASIINIYYQDNRKLKSFNWSLAPRNIIISGNIFDTLLVGKHAGAYVNIISIYRVNSVIISNNIFRNLAGDATLNNKSSCILMGECKDIIIANNKINMNGACGIYMYGNCIDITISDNHMTNDQQYNLFLNYGIRIQEYRSGPLPIIKNCKIKGNTINSSLSSIAQVYASGCVFEDIIIADNICSGTSSIQYITRGIITGNTFRVANKANCALLIGNLIDETASVSSHNTIVANNFISVDQPLFGLSLQRVRASNINQNMFINVSTAISLVGSNKVGELDFLNIKDNFSNQTDIKFLKYTTTDTNSIISKDLVTVETSNNRII